MDEIRIESPVDDVVVIENHEKVSKSVKTNERGWSRIFVSDEAKRRTKRLFEKAMSREKNNKILKGHEILDCDIIELNDSNDFSHQSKLLRTEKINQKPKTHTLPRPSTSSVSEDDAHNIGQTTTKKVKDIYSNALGKGLPCVQPKNSKPNGQKACRLCHEEFTNAALKDHILSCMKHNFEHTSNENHEAEPCCDICGKDLSLLSNAKRASHINACLDLKEDEKKQKEELEKQLQQAQSIILNCPVCQKKFRSALSRTKHLKKCALSNNLSVEQIKNLAKQQEEEHKNQLDAGILPEDIKASLLKNTAGKPKAKKRICEEDEDFRLAVALSTSLTEEREKTLASSLHSAQSSKSANLLLNLSKNQAEERISKRAASLVFNASPPEESASQTPAFKRRKQELDSPQQNKFWDKTSLASPLKRPSSTLPPEQEQSKQKPSVSTPYKISSVSRDSYYVPVLMPPVTVDDTYVGNKLKRVSAIPGRQRSMGGQGRQSEEENSTRSEVFNENNPGVDSPPQVEVQSQTVADLAELAAENENEDSQSNEDLFEPRILSPDINDWMDVDIPSVEASHQPEEDSCELKKLSSSFLSLVNCPYLSDVQIVTSQGEIVPAHKVVLFARCPELYKKCEDGLIDFSSYRKESVLSVLKYIYGGEICLGMDNIEDVIRMCESLCLSSLSEKAEKIWNEKERSPSCLSKDIAGNACLEEDQCPESFKEEERDEPADKACFMDQDINISNQSSEDFKENVTSTNFSEGEGDHAQGVCQPASSVEQGKRNTSQQYGKPADVYEMSLGDKQVEAVDELSAQKIRDNASQAAENQQLGINAYNGHKENMVCTILCGANPAPYVISFDNVESLNFAKSTIDVKSQSDEKSGDNEDDNCKPFSNESTNFQGKEEMLDPFAAQEKSCAETHYPSLIPKAENIDAMPSSEEDSKTVIDNVQNVEMQSTSQSTSGQQILNKKQELDKGPIVTQLNEPLFTPVSEMAQPLSSNQVPSGESEVQSPSSVPVEELSNTLNTDLQELNVSLLHISSSVPSMQNKVTKSKGTSKKVSAREFKSLVGKAEDGSLTEEDFEKIAIKIEQGNCFLGKDAYIPSVLDDAELPDPDELQITNAFIRSKKSKRANSKSVVTEFSYENGNPSLEKRGPTKHQKQRCKDKERMEAEIPVTKPVVSYAHLNDTLLNSFQSLTAVKTTPSKQNDNASLNLRKDICTSESKASTSYNSDVLFNSDDDLFDDIEEEKDKKKHASGPVSTTSIMDSSDGCLIKSSNSKPERKDFERSKANLQTLCESDRNSKGNSQVNEQDTHLQDAHLVTDSEQMQMELASAIAAEIENVRNAEDLSQIEDMDSREKMFSSRQSVESAKSRSTTDFHPSTKPAYAESTPGSESRQVRQMSLQDLLPDCVTPIKRNSVSDSPKLNSSSGSSSKKKTQRGLARLKKNTQTSSPSTSPHIPTTNVSNVKTFSDSSCCSLRKEGDDRGNGEHVDRNSALSGSDKSSFDDVTNVSGKQLEECRRNLNFDEQTAVFSRTTEINETCSQLPSLSLGPKQTLSSDSLLESSVVTSKFMSSTVPHTTELNTSTLSHTSKSTNSTLPHTSKSTNSTVPHTSKSTNSTLSHTSMSTNSTLPHTSKSTNSTLSHTSKSTNSTVSHASKLTNSTLSHTSKSTNSTLSHISKSTNTTVPHTSKLTNSTFPHTSKFTIFTLSESANSSISHSSKCSTSNLSQTSSHLTKAKDNENSIGLCQTANEVQSNSVQLSFVNAHSELISPGCRPSISQSATNSVLLSSAPGTPKTKRPQSETIDATTPPSSTKDVLMSYSPVIKKGKGALNSAMTDVSFKLPSNNNDKDRNNCPLSSLLIDSIATAKCAASSKKTTSSGVEERCKSYLNNKEVSTDDVDLASSSVLLSEGMDVVPLRERLGIENPFGMKTKQLQSTTTLSVGKSGKALPHLTEMEASTSKKGTASQDESLQSVHQRCEKPQINQSMTPRGQMMRQEKKSWKEPSPFSPMPAYDEMDTPQLKKEVSKIGVRPMNKKRMNILLKEVYRETHQYETDSDYEPTPVKQKRMDSSSIGFVPPSSVCQSFPEGSASDVAAGRGGNGFDPTISSHAKLASSSRDVNSDAKEGDDPLSSSQESSNSDIEDLAEESILQGWPDEEEVNPIQVSQSGSENTTERLLVFLRTNPDMYEKILIYEPLELDVLKKMLTEAGIRIGLLKLMDFLDEQCITFSMKNMSNRNNRPQRGRVKTGSNMLKKT